MACKTWDEEDEVERRELFLQLKVARAEHNHPRISP